MFSIIVPSYNRQEEIPALLEHLIQQTVHNFEVIIVDDCSKEKVIIKKDYPFKVTVIRNEQNQGAAESRNIGAKNATQDWLLFLDDDDRFEKHKCEILGKKIAENPVMNFIYHPAKCVMVNEKFSYVTHPLTQQKDLNLENMLLANKIGGMPMIGIKKSFFFALGGLSTQLKSLEDYEFVLKVISSPELKPCYVDHALTECTFHTQRASVSTNLTNTEQAIAFIQKNYVKTPIQQQRFAINSLYMLAYPYIMNLSRKAGIYYWKMFKLSKNIKPLIIAIIIFISPKLAIHLKRFI
ncbi:glycosyltransferase [Avibacterium sp. 20-15]|uniref:glycosyltransferase family 2 protein n=1 Tax=unclassified Avibacterium TaxID=2685287 RepID=UPI002026F474|nr:MULTISPECIES: glycosyltransferase [unclassified Avibacterium]MCW9732129.1 glycosyltransferase [Avibacterium sp. 20-15]URL04306.1 glycosyltransferase [Avibacterium sp. 20-132]